MAQQFYSWYILKRIKNVYLYKYSYINNHHSIIHSSQKVEATQMFINWWMDEQSMVYLYNGILYSYKNEWSSDTFYNMNEPWKHYDMWKKPVIRNHILYDSIYTKWNRQSIERESGLVMHSAGGHGVVTESDCERTQSFFLGWWKCAKLRLWWWVHNSKYSLKYEIAYFGCILWYEIISQ